MRLATATAQQVRVLGVASIPTTLLHVCVLTSVFDCVRPQPPAAQETDSLPPQPQNLRHTQKEREKHCSTRPRQNSCRRGQHKAKDRQTWATFRLEITTFKTKSWDEQRTDNLDKILFFVFIGVFTLINIILFTKNNGLEFNKEGIGVALAAFFTLCSCMFMRV